MSETFKWVVGASSTGLLAYYLHKHNDVSLPLAVGSSALLSGLCVTYLIPPEEVEALPNSNDLEPKREPDSALNQVLAIAGIATFGLVVGGLMYVQAYQTINTPWQTHLINRFAPTQYKIKRRVSLI